MESSIATTSSFSAKQVHVNQLHWTNDCLRTSDFAVPDEMVVVDDEYTNMGNILDMFIN